MPEARPEIRLPTRELRIDVPYYTKTPGMRMDKIATKLLENNHKDLKDAI